MTDIVTPSGQIPLSHGDGLREVIRQFTPNWFAVSMGSGILATILAQLPIRAPVLREVAEALWVANIGLFVLFSLLYAARWVLFFGEARRIFQHPVMSMSLGCIPMALATLVNGILLFAIPRWGQTAVQTAQALWALDAFLAVACGVGLPYLMFTRQDHALERMTAVWLLPIVAAEVAAVSGGLLAPHVADAQTGLAILVFSYGLWALSVPLALGILVILVLRMALHKLPDAAMSATSWLTLGPIGTGALGLVVLGQAAPALFAANGLPAGIGQTALGLGVIGGLLLWAYGLWWLAMAVLVTLHHVRNGVAFNLGWWGYIFPLGSYTLATLRLASLLPLPILTGFGEALAAGLILIWLVVAARTAGGAWRRDLFFAPCLADA
jgi:C4-dicarboxylate transporter/malic acid transport protein